MSAPVRPVVDRDNAAYFEGLQRGELHLQRCAACAEVRFPPLPACPRCGDEGVDDLLASGRGELYSWIVVHRAFSDAFADDVPYAVGVVSLAEGGRVLARLELSQLADGEVSIGMAVEARFVEREGWTELRFAPEAAEAARG